MWIVRLALRRPYTFVVVAILVLILGVFTIFKTPTDIFPDIDIPVISVVFNYSGMSAEDMEKHIVTGFERILTTTVNDVEHTESQSLYGIATSRSTSSPGQDRDRPRPGNRHLPDGAALDAAGDPAAAGDPVQRLERADPAALLLQRHPARAGMFDQAINFVRPRLVTVPGVQIPYPYGGKQRQVMVDLDPERLYAWNISPSDVSNAIGAQNLILPAGTDKDRHPGIPRRAQQQPAQGGGPQRSSDQDRQRTPVYIKDVAHVRDGFQVQTSLVHVGGKRGVLLSILKNGGASTLDVVDGVKKALQRGGPAQRAQGHSRFSTSRSTCGPRSRGGPRGRDRGGADRPDDPRLPRQLAEHGGRHHLDSAFDPGLHHHHELARARR
jgi:multidrug efflux pump subunit AcrB